MQNINICFTLLVISAVSMQQNCCAQTNENRLFIAQQSDTADSGMITLSDAGKIKKARDIAERQRKQRMRIELQKRLANERERRAKLARLKQQGIEKQKLATEQAREAAERNFQIEEARRIQERTNRLAREADERRTEQERLASIERERQAEENRRAHQEHKTKLEPYVNAIRVVGFLGDRALLVLPERANRAILLGKGEQFNAISVVSIGEHDLALNIEGESFIVPVRASQYLLYDRTSDPWNERFVHDAQQRIMKNANTTNTDQGPTVTFTVGPGGEPSDFSMPSEDPEVKVILGCAPFRPLFYSQPGGLLANGIRLPSAQVKVSLGRIPQVRVISIDLPAELNTVYVH